MYIVKRLKRLPLDGLLAAMFLSMMSIITFINILGRFIFHYSLSFTEEIGLNFFVYVVVLGTGLAFKDNAHPSFITIFSRFSKKSQRYLEYFFLSTAACVFVIIDTYVIKMIYQDITLFHSTSPALGIPMWIYYFPIPIFSLAVFYRLYERKTQWK